MFTDNEYRILLSAIGRERKICEEMEKHMVREPYEISLIDICKAIYRKIHDIQHRYGWHDLRKNPDDLPKNHDRILFFTIEYDDDAEVRYYTGEYFEGIGFSNDDYEGYVTMGSYNNDEVLAWRYIEPFEED